MTEDFFEYAVASHLALLLIATSWAFGGNADSVRVPLAALASAGPLLLILGTSLGAVRGGVLRRLCLWLWPFALVNALVLASCLTPGLRTLSIEGSGVLIPLRLSPWRPSAAVPAAALMRLWIFDGTYLSCFNIILLIHKRRTLRRLLGVVVINAFVLALFGIVQKLGHASGLYFGRVHSPQPAFFSTFVYDNHWGAFALLMAGATLGLAWRQIRSRSDRGLLYSPALGTCLAALVIAVSVPLSGSRLCTVLMALLVCATGIRQLRLTLRREGPEGSPRRRALVVACGLGALALGGAATWFVAGDVLAARLEKTREQFTTMHAGGRYEFRGALYRDTLRMARARPWFGWGMGSYPFVFMFYNSTEPNPADHLPVYYHDAHSDWLQALAEHGIVGAALLALCAAVPWLRTRAPRRPFPADPFIRCLLAGCAVVLGYALIEFPFGNTAVGLAWWLCFFSALRYTRLCDSRVPSSEPAP